MKNYYDILEITKDASAGEIKRAYFKQVKQCSPEKDPEGFKILRTAYETLKDDTKRKAYDQKQEIPEYLVEELHRVNDMLENLHTKEAIVTLEYLTKKYPTEPAVAIVLGETYLYAGSSGKAVKYLEQAAESFKENQAVQLMLAKAYEKRGYHNKALKQFQQVVTLDQTNASAWQAYIEFCDREYAYYRSRAFYEAMAIDEDMFVDNNFNLYAISILSNLESYFLFTEDDFDLKEQPEVLRYLDLYIKGVKQHGRIPDEQLDIAFAVAGAICKAGEVSKVKALIPYLEAGIDNDEEFKNLLTHIKETITLEELMADNNISDELKGLMVHRLTSTSDCPCPNCKDEQLKSKTSILVAKTEIISQISVYKESILYLKENHPHMYAKEEAFFTDALNPANARNLEKKLQNELTRFFKKHSSQMKKLLQEEDVDYDFDAEMDYNPGTTYVRQTPKIGRNEPCPCGSGKKYKRCCG